MAVCLLDSVDEDEGEGDDDKTDVAKEKRRLKAKEEAAKLMARVPSQRQKIAGKSIPLEVRPSVRYHLPYPPLISSCNRNSSHAKHVNSNPNHKTSPSPLSNFPTSSKE